MSRSPSAPSAAPTGTTPAAARIVALVARREFDARVRTRSYLLGLLITAMLLGVIVVVPAVLNDETTRLGLVGDAALADGLDAAARQADVELTVSEPPDEPAARAALQRGDLDAVLARQDGGYRLLVESETDPQVRAVVDSAVAQQAIAVALAQRGLDPQLLTEVVPPVTLTALDPPDPEADQRRGIAFVVVMLLYFQLAGFGVTVAMGVVEEKTSRVVEVLLATIRPWQLLLGKVLGIGGAGLLQLVLLGGLGLSVGSAMGVITLTGTAVSVFAASIGWFLLGFLFFAVLYAAAGALVARQEELNAVTTPMMLLLLAPFLIAVFSLDSPTGGLAATLSWVPPFSPILMPIEQASGRAEPGMIVLAAVLMLAAIALFTRIGGRIYARSVLRTGSRVRLTEVLRRGS